MNQSSKREKRQPQDIKDIALLVADHIGAMLAYWDKNKICRFANNAYQEWFGKTREELIGIRLEDLLGPLYLQNLCFIEGVLRGTVQVFEREIPTPDGEIRHSLTTYTPDIEDGMVRGFFVHVADVTSLKMVEKELQAAKERAEELATHDFLTGLPNRVLLMDRIKKAIAMAERKNGMIAVMNMDMDNFKQVNDTYGHSEGDRLLIEIANRMKTALRESDTVTRLGGDEFILLALEIDTYTDIRVILGRLMESIRQPYEVQNEIFVPTFSTGIAVFPMDGRTPERLLISSDEAMYKAKKQGKDCFCFTRVGTI
ncbi:hypothetical protein CH373_08855 [Leptospira perolatii]|uniref:GGDEF domain-containing protein n=1 Tax=Leptospira perolatii TaxID=2023191 RepID=A0A2M9ZNG1_9LEPT|nr:GGDEF domain-containing protein [Leptospira perolatii]PJZ69610.1 hypothetical protein CH360_10000 [Leptospira perolatii]PJZ73597.1 hypothetical protein CH373_08855 [Leptospira perolatii]